jgi:hypothetical protein
MQYENNKLGLLDFKLSKKWTGKYLLMIQGLYAICEELQEPDEWDI